MMKKSVSTPIYFGPFAKVENEIYACSMETNGLFKLNDANEAQMIALFPGEKSYQRNLFSDCIVCGKKMIFAPESAEHIQIFDMESHRFETIKFETDCEEECYMKMYKFSRLIETEEDLFFMPETYPFVLKMKKETFEITYISVGKMPKKFFAKKQYACVEKTYYMVSANSPYVLKFDVKRECGEIVNIPSIGGGATGIYVVGDEAWVLSKSRTGMLNVDLGTFNTEYYSNDIMPFEVKRNLEPYVCGVVFNDRIRLIPMEGDSVVDFDCKGKKFVKGSIIKKLKVDDLSLGAIFQVSDGALLVRRKIDMWDGKRECVWLTKNLEVNEVQFRIIDYSEYRDKLIAARERERGFYNETNLFGLIEFMEGEIV